VRVLVVSRPQFFVPPDQFPVLFDAFADWRERYRGSMESFEFFAGGGGGFGVINVPDEAALNQMMLEYPFLPFSDIEVRPLLDGDAALGQWRQAMQQMISGTP
jgi:muconolactone delta-isomerase